MRKAGHHSRFMPIGLINQRLDQTLKALNSAVRLITNPHPEIQRDLIVARPACVQTPGRFANQFLQPRLDIHVNVFQRGRKLKCSPFNL